MPERSLDFTQQISTKVVPVITHTHTHTRDPQSHTKIEHGLVSGVVKEPNEAQINMSSKGNIGIWTKPYWRAQKKTKDKPTSSQNNKNIDTQKVFMNS